MTLSGLARLWESRPVLGLWIRQKVVDGCIETQEASSEVLPVEEGNLKHL